MRIRLDAVFSLAAAVALFVSLASAGNALAVTTTYNCTGSNQTFTVPAGISSLAYTVKGAGGGNGGSGEIAFGGTKGGGGGGTGASYTGTWGVSAGDVVTIKVGCKGNNGADKRDGDGGGSGGWGFFTGGNGGNAGNRNCGFFGCSKFPTGGAGGGGGASGISIGSLSVVAGGGGGGGGGAFWSDGKSAYGATQGAALANGSNGPKNGDGNGGSGGSGGGGGNAGGGVSGDNGGNGGQNGRSAASTAGAISATLDAGGGATATNSGSVTITYFSTVSISGLPAAASNSASASATFATADASTTFECKLDSGSWAACTSPFAITSLTEGSHTLYVRGKDSAANTGGESSKTWTVDLTPPANPVLTGGPTGVTRQSKSSIAWSGDLANGQTATCSVDGGSFTTCPASPATRTGLTNGNYSFAVKVTDPAGNSTTTTRSWKVNTSLPASVSGDTGAAISTTKTVTAKSLSAGYRSSCIATSEGSVDCWGNNSSGPSSISGITNAVQVSVGFNSACATLSTGAVSCWGGNEYGQLGDGTTTTRVMTPASVSGITNAVQVSVGLASACATLSTGAVSCWGWGTDGQLGNAAFSNRSTPVTVSGIANAVQVAAGNNFACATLSTGGVKCWGANTYWQLGNHPYSISATPVSISGITNAIQVSPAQNFACATLSTGTVKCWGANSWGQLGDGTIAVSKTEPVSVSGLTNAVQVATRQRSACATLSTGAVKCWGDNTGLQLDTDGIASVNASPVGVSGIADAVSAPYDTAVGWGFACAIVSSGSSVKCWGYNDVGQLGDGTTNTSGTPVSVSKLKLGPVTSTAVPAAPVIAPPAATTGSSTDVTFKGEKDGSFECRTDGGDWGACTSPKSLTGLADGWHSFAVRVKNAGGTSDESTVSWVADGTPPSRPTVSSSAVGTTRQTGATVTWSATTEAGDTVTCSVDGGSFGSCGTSPRTLSGLTDGDHSFAVKATDAFGNSSTGTASWKVDRTAATTVSGDTGDPTTTSADLTGVSKVSAGGIFSCALMEVGGKVACWGGIGDLQNPVKTPVEIAGISGATAISVGDAHACALIDNGKVKCWGMNDSGQIGTNAPAGSFYVETPVEIAGISGATAIAAGYKYSCATLGSSGIACWGRNADPSAYNSSGRLGNGEYDTNFKSATPVMVKTSYPFVELKGAFDSIWVARQGTMCAIDSAQGTPWCWGDDASVVASQVNYIADPAPVGVQQVYSSLGSVCFGITVPAGIELECMSANFGGSDPSRDVLDRDVLDVASYGLPYNTPIADLIDSTCAVVQGEGGEVMCWGDNRFGQLGNGTTTRSYTPVRVDLGAQAVTTGGPQTISVGAGFACAIVLKDGKRGVKCWGDGSFGQLGNGGRTSSSTPVTVGGGTTTNPPPAPVIAAPSATTATSADVTFKGEKGATFECRLDSGSWAACASPKSLSALSTGWHSFSVRAKNSGGTGEASTVSWVASTGSPPAKPILSGAPTGTVKATTASISFTSDVGATFLCSLDGGPASACTSPRALTGLTDGSHTLTVQAVKDSLTSEAASATWVVDTTAPAAPTLSGAPTGSTSSKSASISFTGEPGGSFLCSVDNGSYGPCTSPRTLTDLADGPHSLRVTQADSAGNVSSAATASWTVVTPPAKPSLSGAPTGTVKATTASISFTGVAGATFVCSLDGGAYGACTSPRALTGLTDGSHTFAVKAVKDGITSDEASATWTVDATPPAAPTLSGAPSGSTSSKSASISFTGEPGGSFL
ncbi:MAG: hypothetical protein WCO96_08795, partial [Actinomycetes bacterium]